MLATTPNKQSYIVKYHCHCCGYTLARYPGTLCPPCAKWTTDPSESCRYHHIALELASLLALD